MSSHTNMKRKLRDPFLGANSRTSITVKIISYKSNSTWHFMLREECHGPILIRKPIMVYSSSVEDPCGWKSLSYILK